jgi:alpha-glucosidase
MWWDDAIIYQVYIRSFQDTDGDGIGDLPGVTSRLDHIAALGADAVWLSPIYPSPDADFGYDVSDFRATHPRFGSLSDLDALIGRAHGLGLRVLLDFVPCHTSTEHPWFREHPDYYVWAQEPQNNWRAAFGDSSWGLDELTGRYFLHSFFPEQADLNWRNPAVRRQMIDAMRFWLARGIDGFRLDALDRLMKDPDLRDDPPAKRVPVLPGDAADMELEHIHSRNAPGLYETLDEIRASVGDDTLLIGEVYLPLAQLQGYLQALDIVFNFEALFGVEDAGRLRGPIEQGLATPGQGWVLSNHDFSRLVTRAGEANARAVLMLLLLLPGPAFVYQGDELGYRDMPTSTPQQDRNGRDRFRVPMVWDDAVSGGGFTTGVPWLAAAETPPRGVAQQCGDPESVLSLTRATVTLRRTLRGRQARLLDSAADTIVLRRGGHVVAVNLGDQSRPAPGEGELVLEACPGDGQDLSIIPAHGGWVARIADR